MSDNFSFNSAGREASTPREDGPMPAGWYRMWIVATEIKPTKKNDGKRLELEFDVIDGQHKGRKAWEGLNVENPSEQAQEIALKDLTAICMATGVLKFTTPAQLHRKPMMVKLGIEKKDGYKDRNVVLGYKASDQDARPTVPRQPVAAGVPKDDAIGRPGIVDDVESDDLPF